jgi:hypothetical protein
LAGLAASTTIPHVGKFKLGVLAMEFLPGVAVVAEVGRGVVAARRVVVSSGNLRLDLSAQFDICGRMLGDSFNIFVVRFVALRVLIHPRAHHRLKLRMAELTHALTVGGLDLFRPIVVIDAIQPATLAEEAEHVVRPLENVGAHVAAVAQEARPGDQVEEHVAAVWLLKPDVAAHTVVADHGHLVLGDVPQEALFGAGGAHTATADATRFSR